MPETNFDLDAKEGFEEIKDLTPALFRKIFEKDIIFNEIILNIVFKDYYDNLSHII